MAVGMIRRVQMLECAHYNPNPFTPLTQNWENRPISTSILVQFLFSERRHVFTAFSVSPTLLVRIKRNIIEQLCCLVRKSLIYQSLRLWQPQQYPGKKKMKTNRYKTHD